MAAVVSKSITVNQKGGGNFTTIQQAIDSVPAGNTQWIRIHVAAGVYREKVTVPQTKRFVLLEGEGRRQTSIEWADHVVNDSPTDKTATFDCFAQDFMARDITFKNTYVLANDVVRAVAAQPRGDRAAFYRCGFIGVQDTLSDLTGRHYYKDCYIEGAIDFVFGFGQSIFETCTLWTAKVPAGKSPGFVTAQGRDKPTEDTGFVFNQCTLDGVTPVYLGRAWRDYARVIFYKTKLSAVVVSKGWDAWHSIGREGQLTMVETGCSGLGANTAGRVKWSKKEIDVSRFVNLTYISADGWLAKQPQ